MNRTNLAPSWLFALLAACVATVLTTDANADELRVVTGSTLTVYSGELLGISPMVAGPNFADFRADKVRVFPTAPSALGVAKAPLAWTIDVLREGEPALRLDCRGNVPAYIGLTFSFDVTCAQVWP